MARICMCCLKEVDQIHVCSSVTGPVSLAFCQECLNQSAEPEWTFHYLYDFASNNGEGLVEWVKDLSTYKDGQYISWDSWVRWRQTEPQKSELDAKFQKEMEEYHDQIRQQEGSISTEDADNSKEHW